MHIVLLSILTPASENIRGTSALPYHLMAQRDKSVKITIFSYNFNDLSQQKIKEVSNELDVSIILLKKPKWIQWVLSSRITSWLRVFLKYPIHNYLKLQKPQYNLVKELQPDSIWIYGEEMSRISKQFINYRRVHTLPDSESLYYYRLIRHSYVVSNKHWYRRLLMMMTKFVNMERDFDTSDCIKYHVVGQEDAVMLSSINPKINVRFIRHPHYHISSQIMNKFKGDKIKVLVAGQKNIYMKYGICAVLNCFLRNHKFIDCYEITFLGKWWQNDIKALRDYGYDVKHIEFADDYIEEISNYDIQITPINIGTGTKGKVLDALANGLLVIGTKYAFENIAVKHGESCLEYNTTDEIEQILSDILTNRDVYERIAYEGRKCVLENHNPQIVSRELFKLLK